MEKLKGEWMEALADKRLALEVLANLAASEEGAEEDDEEVREGVSGGQRPQCLSMSRVGIPDSETSLPHHREDTRGQVNITREVGEMMRLTAPLVCVWVRVIRWPGARMMTRRGWRPWPGSRGAWGQPRKRRAGGIRPCTTFSAPQACCPSWSR